jgi:hypothetical protein
MTLQQYFRILSIGLAVLVFVILTTNTGMQRGGLAALRNARSEMSVWELAQSVRPGSGGMEADRDTWQREEKVFKSTVEKGVQEWNINVLGDARPVMRRLSIENVGNDVSSPFVWATMIFAVCRNWLLRSRQCQNGKGKALAIRELLSVSFFFHYSV